MARRSFKKQLHSRIQEEREKRGVSGASLLEDRSAPAPNPRHMVAFSSDDLPALRSGRRPPHGPSPAGGAATATKAPAAASTRPPGEKRGA